MNNEALEKLLEKLLEQMNDAIQHCPACDGHGSYWISSENVRCSRCGPWRNAVHESEAEGTMTEKEFLQQLFLLRCDIEACPMLDHFAAQQRDRWAARLGDLLNRRNAKLDSVEAGHEAKEPK